MADEQSALNDSSAIIDESRDEPVVAESQSLNVSEAEPQYASEAAIQDEIPQQVEQPLSPPQPQQSEEFSIPYSEPSLYAAVGSSSQPSSRPQMVDMDIQTPTHIVEKNIDHKYTWNEWELRRRAVQLANLRQKETHSMQTKVSHFRRDSETQVNLPKNNSSQTRVDAAVNPKKEIRYVAGLRGAPSASMNVVNLTLDL